MKFMCISMMCLILVSSICLASDTIPLKSVIKRLATQLDLDPQDRKDRRFALVYLKSEPNDYGWNFPHRSGLHISDYDDEINVTIKNRVIFSYLMPRDSKLKRMPVICLNDETHEHFYKLSLVLIGSKIENNAEFQSDCPLYEMQESTKKFKLTFPLGCNADEFMEHNTLKTLQCIVPIKPSICTRPALLSKDSNHAVEIIPKDEQSYRLMDDIVKKKKQNATKIRGGFLAIDMRDYFEQTIECNVSQNVITIRSNIDYCHDEKLCDE